MELSPLEFFLVATAAIVMAADEAIGRAAIIRDKMPRLTGLLRFVPALLLIAGATLYGLRQTGIEIGDASRHGPKAALITIEDKTFQNTRVPLDGHSYRHCHFINVTFVYNGIGGTELISNKVDGYTFASDDPKVNNTLAVLKGLGLLSRPLMTPEGKIIELPHQ